MKTRVTLVILVAIVLCACGGKAADCPECPKCPDCPPASEPQIVEKIVKETVIVEKEVTVVVAPTEPPPPPTATPTQSEPVIVSAPVVVTRVAYDKSTRLSALVMVTNPNQDWWLDKSQVVVSVFDADGNIIATEKTMVVVPPGGVVPAAVTGLNLADRKHDKVQVELLGRPLEPLSTWPDVAVELVQSNAVGDRVVGQIRNVGSVTVDSTKIVVAIYDAAGETVFLDYSFADAAQPDQVVPFDMSAEMIPEGGRVEVLLALWRIE